MCFEKTTKITKTITTEDGKKKVALDEEALRKVLKNPKYAKYRVAVYTIIGPYRSGKSFMLNVWITFIRRSLVSETKPH